MKVLFSWVGFKDLNYIGSKIGNDKFAERLKKKRPNRPSVSQSSDHSPIADVLTKLAGDGEGVSHLYLFYDIGDEILCQGLYDYFGKKYRCQVEVVSVSVGNTHVYDMIWEACIAKWNEIKRKLGKDIEPFFNLSSGTMAMNAAFIVLGEATFSGEAKFIQVDDGGKVSGPFPIDFDLGGYAARETLKGPEDILPAFDPIIGNSPQIKRVKKMGMQAAHTDLNVLIYGESGTGKELLAKAIHDASARKNGKYRAINCAGIPSQLMESMLFGHKRGAFTGADRDHPGWFRELNGGTLFLDEVEACPEEVQAKLLRALQPPEGGRPTCRRFTPLGTSVEEESDVRIIAATNKPLEETGFRNDLLNRLATLRINIPPLRERSGDLPLLRKKLLEKIKMQLGPAYKDKTLDDSAKKLIDGKAWHGNVRELMNALYQAVVFSDGETITADDFYQDAAASPAYARADMAEELSRAVDLKEIAKDRDLELKKRYIDAARKKTGGNKSKAADLLGITYQTLDNWEDEYGKRFGIGEN